jgi:antitoxin component of MazEF toxin-antitoxin module
MPRKTSIVDLATRQKTLGAAVGQVIDRRARSAREMSRTTHVVLYTIPTKKSLNTPIGQEITIKVANNKHVVIPRTIETDSLIQQIQTTRARRIINRENQNFATM